MAVKSIHRHMPAGERRARYSCMTENQFHYEVREAHSLTAICKKLR